MDRPVDLVRRQSTETPGGYVALAVSRIVSDSAFGHTGATGSALIVDPESDLVIVHLRTWWGVAMAATDETKDAIYGALTS